MPGETIVVVVFILVFGCAAFLFGVLYLLYRIVYGAGRYLIGCLGLGHGGPSEPAETPPTGTLVCPRPQCGKTESRSIARFCSRCGTPLRPSGADESR